MNQLSEIFREHLNSAPVNIEGLIRALGLLLDKKAELDPRILGQIERIRGGFYKISVNKDDHYFRQRFTMAHELGHYILHRSLIEDGIDDDTAYRSTDAGNFHNRNIVSRHETEANKFAASILMPEQLVTRLRDEGISDVSTLARKLQVSPKAMEIRLETLGVPGEAAPN